MKNTKHIGFHGIEWCPLLDLSFIRAIKISQRKSRLYPSSKISGNLNIFKIFCQLIINVRHLSFIP